MRVRLPSYSLKPSLVRRAVLNEPGKDVAPTPFGFTPEVLRQLDAIFEADAENMTRQIDAMIEADLVKRLDKKSD